jgi:hypothetical protein
MRFSFCIALCALAFSFGSRAAQAAGIYNYEVGSLPSSLGSCEAAKNYVSGRFATVTGLTPTRVECDAAVDPLLGIVNHYYVNVFYRAERRLRLVSIGTEGVGGGGGEVLGTYHEQSQCQADLSRQIELFERATHLTTVVAYCYMIRELVAHPWEVRLDAFGTPAAYPQHYSALVSKTAPPASRALVQSIRERLEAAGAVVRAVEFDYVDPEGAYFSVDYYSYQPLNFRRWDDYLPDQRICEYERSALAAIFARDHYEPLASFCAVRGILDWSLIVISSGDWPYETEMLPYTFATLAECHAAIPQALADFEDLEGMVAHGGYCGGTGTAFHISVLKAYD